MNSGIANLQDMHTLITNSVLRKIIGRCPKEPFF